MSTKAACEQCRAAKVRCDRNLPSCGRCAQRNLDCTGLSTNTGYLFLNENEVARRNSQRARGECGSTVTVPVDFTPAQTQEAQGIQQTATFDERSEDSLKILYPWLNQCAMALIPEPLKRSVETRAIECFFISWVLHPSRDGSPGHMANLPLLYYSAPPDSALVHAVRTVAFADVRHTYEQGVSFNTMARGSYGFALSRIREITELESELASDQAFAALLLIDSFETVYLASEIPLGRHGEAIKYLLRLRGSEQMFSRSNFSLWSLANHRLQARQMLRHEEPDAVQLELLDLLDTGRPDIRICADAMKMTALCATADKLMRRRRSPGIMAELLESIERLVNQIHELNTDTETWASTISQTWRPKLFDAPMMVRRPRKYQYSPDHPLAHLYCAKLIAYPDVWLAFIWGFHAACQIIMRETLIALLEFQARVQGRGLDQGPESAFEQERRAVEALAASIIGAFPTLMGFTNSAGEDGGGYPQGLMAGRCLALFALEVIHKAKYPRFEHKDGAEAVIRWMSASYVLD